MAFLALTAKPTPAATCSSRDIHEAPAKVNDLMDGGLQPKSLVAGFLSAANQKYLAEQENILSLN